MASVRAPTLEKPSFYRQSTHLLNKINSTFIVSIIFSLRLVQIIFIGSSHGHYKGLPSMNYIFTCTSFFSSLFVCLFLSFSSHTFHGLARAYVNPGSFSLFVHSLVCPITHSFLDGFQPTLVQYFPQVCSTCHTIFNLKKTLECVCERLLHCRLISAITWIPGK